MTIRFTLAEKWQDVWFRKLIPVEKLLFLYICDNCNIAGIWEIDLEQAAFSIGESKGAIQGAYKGLIRGYELLDEAHIWVKNFLKHQRNLPLNPNNAAHATIINLLLPYKRFSESILQLLSTDEIKGLTRGLQSPLSISISKGISESPSKSKGKERFVTPTERDIKDYCREKNIYVDPKQFIFFYGSKGWMVGKSKMKDWRLAVCRAISWECNQDKQPSPKIKPKDGQVGLEQKRQEIRKEYSLTYREKSVEELRKMLKAPALTTHHWIIKEILKEQAK